MTLSVMTLSIKTLIMMTLKIITVNKYRVSFALSVSIKPIMMSVSILNVILIVMEPSHSLLCLHEDKDKTSGILLLAHIFLTRGACVIKLFTAAIVVVS